MGVVSRLQWTERASHMPREHVGDAFTNNSVVKAVLLQNVSTLDPVIFGCVEEINLAGIIGETPESGVGRKRVTLGNVFEILAHQVDIAVVVGTKEVPV